MSEHRCLHEEFIGQVKEFMENYKGLKRTLFVVAMTILIQVGTFLYLWGGLVTTVKNHDDAIHSIMAKLDKVKIVGYAIPEVKNGEVKI